MALYRLGRCPREIVLKDPATGKAVSEGGMAACNPGTSCTSPNGPAGTGTAAQRLRQAGSRKARRFRLPISPRFARLLNRIFFAPVRMEAL